MPGGGGGETEHRLPGNAWPMSRRTRSVGMGTAPMGKCNHLAWRYHRYPNLNRRMPVGTVGCANSRRSGPARSFDNARRDTMAPSKEGGLKERTGPRWITTRRTNPTQRQCIDRCNLGQPWHSTRKTRLHNLSGQTEDNPTSRQESEPGAPAGARRRRHFARQPLGHNPPLRANQRRPSSRHRPPPGHFADGETNASCV